MVDIVFLDVLLIGILDPSTLFIFYVFPWEIEDNYFYVFWILIVLAYDVLFVSWLFEDNLLLILFFKSTKIQLSNVAGVTTNIMSH